LISEKEQNALQILKNYWQGSRESSCAGGVGAAPAYRPRIRSGTEDRNKDIIAVSQTGDKAVNFTFEKFEYVMQ